MSYYYLISSLPELVFKDEFSRHPYPVFDDFVREEMNGRDYDSLKKCFLLNDIRNITQINSSSEDFITASYYSQEELKQSLKYPDDLFTCIAESLHSSETERCMRLMQDVGENRIVPSDSFCGRYLTFEMRLRNIRTALACRQEGIPYADLIVPFDDFSHLVAESSSVDFSLAGALDCFFPLIEAYQQLKPLDIERTISRIRWNWLDEQCEMSFFSPETVFAFGIKLADIERWLVLNPENGKTELNKILKQLHNELHRFDREESA